MSENKLAAVGDVMDKWPSKSPRQHFRTTSFMLLIASAAVWTGVLLDPQIGPLVLHVVGAFGVALAVMATAMGLGLLGFGIFMVGDRLMCWFRRASQWPEA